MGGRRRAQRGSTVLAALAVVTGSLLAGSVVGAAPLASPTITTTPGQTAVTLSGSTPPKLTDSATLSGGSHPSGTITFTLVYASATVDTETATVHGDGTYSTSTGYTLPTAVTVTGTYQWNASYGGDSANNTASDTNNSNERVVVSSAGPSVSTTPNPTAVTLSGPTPPTLTDSATLSGGYHPSGTMTFTLYYGSTLVDTETTAVHGNGTVSTPTGYTPTLPSTDPKPVITGTYQWDASYGGDGNNTTASDTNNPGEVVVVSSASPSLSTSPDPTSVALSGPTPPTLTDSATLSGGYHPSGLITFTLYYGSTLVDTETANVFGNGTYSTPTGYMPPTNQTTVVGLYQWDASYGGDGNNNMAVDSNKTDEQATVLPAAPSLSTTPNATAVTLGATAVTLTDTATLSGGYHPAGTITFTLYDGSTLVDTEMASVHGNGSYSTPTGYLLPNDGSMVTGTYQWDASYGGDSNNNGISDTNDSAEEVVVSEATPSLTTTPSSSTVPIGLTATTTTDTATLSGGYYPGGTITFTLYLGAALLDTEMVSVSGNGMYTTPHGYPIPAGPGTPGTYYQWDASYSGDLNNAGATDDGAVNERVTLVSPCTAGQTFHFLTATVKAPGTSFTGYFCVNAAGSGTYVQSGGAHGTGMVLTAGSTTYISASGTGLALLGQKNSSINTFTETAPLPMKTGTFTLT